ncbi:type III-B CRISPR module RAMP protein Cmr1 [Sphaerotilus uruguayifluvii]|uniref:CRISPR-associated protein Cmr1 n=1 Tax=Sphaerotilus uruguayifluvii TaxID=2735897 RepID=A0ABX2G9R8_9BURK|nr:type III-B CRISPR module RAMP protein Cmr1 [Leptothrix sp. C29]NRT58057.1 CRISPR-associated protein Cmr1 [Leptothrix sp. C29]
MKTLCASFEIVTPMFLGGSDQQTARLRSSSLKGALRFWWRALNWSHHAAQHPGDEVAALRALHHQESVLFGRSASDDQGGQGRFLMQVVDRTRAAVDQPFETSFDNGILYLLGMGLGSFSGGNHCIRKALDARPGNHFELRLIFHPQADARQISSVIDAVKAFGLLGALGSRARHGMGSVRLTSMNSAGLGLPTWTAPDSLVSYGQALTELLAPARTATGLPPLSAFSTNARIDLSRHDKEANTLLASIGREQQAWRSYGKDGLVNGKDSERNFADDHDLVREVANGRAASRAPRRAVFGLPHNYFFSSDKAKVDVNVILPGQEEGRRASPLLLHVHRVGDRHVAVHILLKARFLPAQASVQIKPGRGRPQSVSLEPDWRVLTDFLDRFKQNPDWTSL